MAEQRLIDANALDGHKFPAYGATLDARERGWNECIEYLKARAKTIDAVPVVHGRWIRANDGQAFFDVEYVCSGCQFVVAVSGVGTPLLYGYKFCPNCGSKMEGGTK